MATCIFHPQIESNSLDGITEIPYSEMGETMAEWGLREWWHPDLPAGIQTDSLRSDKLRLSKYAPLWVKNWTGPYFIEVRYAEGENAPPETNIHTDDDRGPMPIAGILLWMMNFVFIYAVIHFLHI
jgi:hypothetical protein